MNKRIDKWQPLNDGVLIKRIDKKLPAWGIMLTDEMQSNGPILREGIVLACGPGKWIEGTWWYVGQWYRLIESTIDERKVPHIDTWQKTGQWEWLDGYREQMDVKLGMKVLFNARWNDFAHGELRGTGSDGNGPLERPLSYRFDPTVHLVQEGDIAGILNE